MNILPIDWYYESPIDFEHKQYTLLAYLQNVELSFLNHKLSPHLLHMEKMIEEFSCFKKNIYTMQEGFKKNEYFFIGKNPKLIGDKDEKMLEIQEIINFSIPQVKSRIDLGYEILKKYNQILY